MKARILEKVSTGIWMQCLHMFLKATVELGQNPEKISVVDFDL